MANHVVKVLGRKPPTGQSMGTMRPGDLCIVTEAPSGHMVKVGEPVLRTHRCYYFMESRTWCTLEGHDGYYVRDLSKDEEIMITSK